MTHSEDALLLAVIVKGDGALATLSVSVQGSSQKMTLIQDAAWTRLPEGQWLWVRQRGDAIRFKRADGAAGEFKPPLSLSGRSW